MNESGIQAGGLYATRNRDGSYRIVKVLVVEDDVAHIRIYAESFAELPVDLDVSTLTLGSVFTGDFGMGHLPLRLGSFLRWEPTFIFRLEVAEGELDGYRMWRDAGGGVWD